MMVCTRHVIKDESIKDAELKILLRSYDYVFPNDTPTVLPPFYEIEHAMDLLMGLALPNKPAYRCN